VYGAPSHIQRVSYRKACLVGIAAAALAMTGCSRDKNTAFAAEPSRRPAPEAAKGEPPVVVEEMSIPGDLPAFVLSGPGGSCPKMVFLHGMCSHGLGYVQAFQSTARDHGGVLAIQGDIPCGNDGMRTFDKNVTKQEERIRKAFLAACGEQGGDMSDLVLMGYSQGAFMAERMAERHPERYSRLILIGAPTTPAVARLRYTRGAVMISGELDAKWKMKNGSDDLISAGIPSTYLEMPGAKHGQLLEGERIMRDAFDWLDDNARPAL
jgi:pimeloyl-ACP methyl ester carboxylesterase